MEMSSGLYKVIHPYLPNYMHDWLRVYWKYNFDILYDSGVDRFRRQFAHLEEGTAKGEKPSPQLRQNVSLPRLSSKL